MAEYSRPGEFLKDILAGTFGYWKLVLDVAITSPVCGVQDR